MGDSMVNWYYVVGSDRVGPVSEAALQVLFLNNEINDDTYIWKKGFKNWERLKDVTELKFDKQIEETSTPGPVSLKNNVESSLAKPVDEKNEIEFEAQLKTPEKKNVKQAPTESTREINLAQFKADKKESPEIKFSFKWMKNGKNDEMFFIKVGKDRKDFEDDIYGPYSLLEINEALTEKRVNLQTLVYSAGMSSWTKLQDTPINIDYNGISLSEISLNEVPLLIVFESSSSLPLVTIVKKSGVKEAVLLGAGPFIEFKNKTVLVSLYVGSELKVKNIQLMVQNYDKKNQMIECHFLNLSSDAKKIMLNHAI